MFIELLLYNPRGSRLSAKYSTSSRLSANESSNVNDSSENHGSESFITSKSGKTVRMYDFSSINKKAEEINNMEDPKKAQETYDEAHDDINTAYATNKENALDSKNKDLQSLLKESLSATELDKKVSILEGMYTDLEKENLDNSSLLKGELRFKIDRGDVALRGMDETSEDAVEVYKDDLGSVEETSSGTFKQDSRDVTSSDEPYDIYSEDQ